MMRITPASRFRTTSAIQPVLTGRRWIAAALCVAAAWLIAPNGPSLADIPESTQVSIKNFLFSPKSVSVRVGSTVTWSNKDEEPHTVVSDIGLFRSAAMDTNESFSFKFDKPGIYRFVCSIHPQMTGTIVVN